MRKKGKRGEGLGLVAGGEGLGLVSGGEGLGLVSGGEGPELEAGAKQHASGSCDSCHRGETTYAMGWLKWGPIVH
jgi:hypothetical protein